MSFITDIMKTAEQVFIEFLKENNLSMTPQRKIIVETFLETEGHFSAERLCGLVKGKASEIGQATIYRTLKLLVDSGLAESIEVGDGSALYEHSYGHDHHDHLICVHCNRKIEIYDDAIEKRQEEVASELGFKLTRHRMYLFGICPECAGQES
ncbi:Fur family transcriptional regulator [Pseudodesulfovibrio piezophilus]|uniref:Ferric uptake regulation protein n=1 Tax=Pseudodesulfovibrio piezophilus (strain DSM 21447 / JCM 15486 / C1TLV30) TaxID=1322246 RepID=M1WN49_PSEP2|nr:Fur family transcriptional regulator [Pseudodesulfovibrio piezophilus]CCH50165.1 Ferric uptake regulator, Fur family [Pseudodesulfovibrio piezophilus C1TLV30]